MTGDGKGLFYHMDHLSSWFYLNNIIEFTLDIFAINVRFTAKILKFHS